MCACVCRCVEFCVLVYLSVELFNKAIDFYETKYLRCTTGHLKLTIYNFLQYLIEIWQTRKLVEKAQHSRQLF